MKIRGSQTNPFWGQGESKNFGKVAISYAATDDVILDQAFVQYECCVNQAHVIMLTRKNLLKKDVAKQLLIGLEEIKKLDIQGKFKLKLELEDVHSNVEHYLIEKFGVEIGGWLRFGIARNDQVYTDTRMWIRDRILNISQNIFNLTAGLLKVAKLYTETVMPGYTHMRISQPITYGHWLTAKAHHFFDDLKIILNTYDIINICPLGIFEMAGTHLPIDRNFTAKLLGFAGVTPNSLYTANQRGELEAKLIFDLCLLALHIKRTLTEIITFSTYEFQLLAIDNIYTTGGTAQPNLKNPDTLEVMRANMAKLTGAAVETVVVMDSLPSGFNRDTQQTKQTLFKAIEIIEKALPVFTGIMTSLIPNVKQMAKNAEANFAIAPDVTLELSLKGNINFREAYKVIKTLIKDHYLKSSFTELTENMLVQVLKKVLGKKIYLKDNNFKFIKSAKESAFSHASDGGSAPEEVKKQIKKLNQQILMINNKILMKQNLLLTAQAELNRGIKQYI